MKKNILLIASAAVILMSCNSSNETNKNTEKEKAVISESLPNADIMPGADDAMSTFSLSVSEGKRLIAKGIAAHPRIKQKMESGMIIITKGTTNAYIAEELIGLTAEHGQFMSGNISNKPFKIKVNTIPEIIVINGKWVDMPLKDALEAVKQDDIILKGGNLLNYEKRQAAATVSSPEGGTVGRIRPYTAEGPGHLIVPIGLEKETYGNLSDYEYILSQDNFKFIGSRQRVMVHKNAEIFTEIEAIKLFGNVKVIPFASGGIAGSEGASSLVIYGSQQEVDKVMNIISTIKGEPPFIED